MSNLSGDQHASTASRGNPHPQYEQKDKGVIARSAYNIDGVTVGDNTIFTTSKRFYILGIRVHLVKSANIVTTPTFSVGTVGPNYQDILGPTILGGLADDDFYTYMPAVISGIQTSVAPNATIKCRVQLAATAAGVVYVFDLGLIGDYGE